MTTPTPASSSSWLSSLRSFLDARAVTMFFFGFAAGLPILLIFSSLSLWLREAGVERSAVTYFSWAALGYSFKFVWAPLVDKLPLPWLSRTLGRRRSWLLLSQLLIIGAISGMALTDPSQSPGALTAMAFAAVALGFASATQDICIDAYRIESAEQKMQAILSATYIAGYRVGMLVSGAGALFLAAYFGTTSEVYNYDAWKWTYLIMAACMSVGILTTLLRPEPIVSSNSYQHSTLDYLKFFALFLLVICSFIFAYNTQDPFIQAWSASLQTATQNQTLAEFIGESIRLLLSIATAVILALTLKKLKLVNTALLEQSYVAPIQNFFDHNGIRTALLFLAIIGLYRISDIVLGVISNVFYQDLGFSKEQIAAVVKTFGLIMSLVGGFLGGLLVSRLGVYPLLLWGAILAALTNLLFMQLASMGAHEGMLYLAISADNLAAGLASAAFVAFLSSLTNVSFTAVQYAIFSSLMTLIPKVLGGYSGSMVDSMGYQNFFLITTVMGLPVIYLIIKCRRLFSDPL